MKRKTLIVLTGALMLFLTFPTCASTSEQKASMENTKVVDSSLSAINLQNTLTAYISEINKNDRHVASSNNVWRKGHQEIALLFSAILRSTWIRAKNQNTILKKTRQSVPKVIRRFTVKSTKENLKDAIANESRLSSTLYPKFIFCAYKANHQPC